MKVQLTIDVSDDQREAIMAHLTDGKVQDKATPAMCKTFFASAMQDAADGLVRTVAEDQA